ncbi:MAG TPA: hypothetical protein VK638_02425 [Edaphobacter sp.]|nr:hypothetical protein [Edaphobacter sp.]
MSERIWYGTRRFYCTVALRAAAKFRWRCATATQAAGLLVFLGSVLYVEHLHVPLPVGQGVADVQKLLLPMELEFMQSFGAGLSPKTIELLPINAEDVSQVVVPTQHGAEDIVEVGQIMRPETETTGITIGLTWRRTARNIKRLKEFCSIIETRVP